jgi:two-component system sensor kinase FixL
MINKETFFKVIEVVFYNAADGIVIIDTSGKIKWINKAFEQIFGYTTEECITNSINIIMPNIYADKHNSYINNYLLTKKSSIIGRGREIIAKDKLGCLFSIHLSVSESHIEDQSYFIGIMHKTTIDYSYVEEKLKLITDKLENYE